MARIEGSAGPLLEIEAGSLAARTTQRPMRVLAWNEIAAQTGALTTIAAGGRLFSMRNSGANLILVRRVGWGFMTTTAFTTAQALDYSLFIARNFTVGDTVGTDVSPTGNMAKHRASLATPNVQARLAAAAVVSGGTLTQDTQAVGIIAAGSNGLATGMVPVQNNLLDHTADDLPIVLAQNEGITIVNNTLMGAAGVIKCYINVEYAEIAGVDYV
jgi:hypothetical protein